jgi:hypothetical protein
MSRVEEIEARIRSFSPDEFRRISQYIRMVEQARWAEQMDRDSVSGKLDFLFEEAEAEFNKGQCRNWPGNTQDKSG